MTRLPLPLRPGVIVLVLLAGLPILWLAGTLVFGASAGGLGAAMLPNAFRETGTLMLGVGVITGCLGLVAAWLVTHFEFPGRRIFDWALILPLAIPTYLAAYCYVEFLDFTGPVQQLVRLANGATSIRQYWFPDIRSDQGAVFVLSMVLYPYVYMSCRAFFLMQSGAVGAAARALGANGWRTFFAITLPLARPALVVGVTLAMMEVVNDLGAVQYFGVNSLTAVIYSTWINRSDFGGAAQLAVIIVLVIALLILAEQWARQNRVYLSNRDSRMPPARIALTGGKGLVAALFCALLFGLGFAVPVGQLLAMAFRSVTPQALANTGHALVTTLTLASLGAVITVALGLYAGKASTNGGKPERVAIKIATLGYAIPGTVLALGLLQPLGLFDRWMNLTLRGLTGWMPGLIISGSIFALLYAYAIRFLAVSHSTLDAALRKRGSNMLDAGRVLGAKRLELLWRVDLPTLLPALLGAGTLVFVEIVKELPGTLLLRPLGVETLSTQVYAQANAGLFSQAALPALAIVLAGLVPAILATRFTQGSKL